MACSVAGVKGLLVVVAGAAVLASGVLVLLQWLDGGRPGSSAVAPSGPTAPASAVAPAGDEGAAEAPSADRPQAFDPATRDLLDGLRESFGPRGSKPNRFRFMRRLDELWGDSPPIAVLLQESIDPAASDGYRAHFAGRLRNLGKSASPGDRRALAAAMREMLSGTPIEIETGLLAQSLIGIDDSPESIGAVDARISGDRGDEETAGLLAGLVLSRSPASRAAVWRHTRTFANAPDSHPLSLGLTLPPLAREPGIPIEPILLDIVKATGRYELFATAVESVFVRSPTGAGVATAEAAIRRSGAFGEERAAQIQAFVRRGLTEWTRHPEAGPEITQPIDSLLERIP